MQVSIGPMPVLIYSSILTMRFPSVVDHEEKKKRLELIIWTFILN